MRWLAFSSIKNSTAGCMFSVSDQKRQFRQLLLTLEHVNCQPFAAISERTPVAAHGFYRLTKMRSLDILIASRCSNQLSKVVG
uniref:Uncharacterized protein n=1 Tax=Ditylenchus dipsaci TaxID=166011 RepID=A0A915DSZ3_9BILA